MHLPLQILTQSKITRRSLFILTMALGWGFAVELVPHFVDINLWPVTADMSEAMKGLNDFVQVSRALPAAPGASAALLPVQLLPVLLNIKYYRPALLGLVVGGFCSHGLGAPPPVASCSQTECTCWYMPSLPWLSDRCIR